MYELAPEELEHWKAATRDVSHQCLREREVNGIAARAVHETTGGTGAVERDATWTLHCCCRD
jgi:hypothetical protein